ncbi:MAG: hypothetical protein ACNA7J_15075 [Wenzhouxiangella sp.]
MTSIRSHDPALLTVVLLAVTLASACGPSARQVKGEAPLVGLDSLVWSNGDLLMNISIRNMNDSRLDVSGLTARFELDGEPAADTRSTARAMSIAPRGREVVQLQGPASPRVLQQLQSLTAGEQRNLPWRLEILIDDIPRRQPAEARGFLHAVPGQPNRFR